MILLPSKHLFRVSLKNKSYLILYHSLFGGAVQVKQGVWGLIQRFKDGIDFPHSFSKKEISLYYSTILDLKKRHFLVKKGIDERAVIEKENQKFEQSLDSGKCYINELRLEMASYCNFRCLHCFAPKIYTWKKGIKMSFRTAKLAVDGFIDILKKTGKKKGGITFWGGEPLLNWKVIKQIVEYVDTATKKSGVSITPGITTNGSLLNDQMLNFMKKHKVTAIVSLDGLEKENDRFRKFINGKGTFKDITKGMAGFSRYGIPFNVELCLNDYNFDSVEKMIDYVHNNYKYNSFVIEPIAYQKSISHFNRHSNQEKAKRIVEIYDYALKKGISLNPAEGKVLVDCAIKPIRQGCYTRHACPGLFTGLYVNPSGLVYNCHRITDPIIGTVEKMDKILRGSKYKYVATRQVGRIRGCRGCKIEGFCQGGCAGTAQFYSGNIYDTSHPLFRSFYCDFYQRLFKEMLRYRVGQAILKENGAHPG